MAQNLTIREMYELGKFNDWKKPHEDTKGLGLSLLFQKNGKVNFNIENKKNRSMVSITLSGDADMTTLDNLVEFFGIKIKTVI